MIKNLRTHLLDTHSQLMNARCGLIANKALLDGVCAQIKDLEMEGRYEYPHTYSWLFFKGRSLADQAASRRAHLENQKMSLEETIENHHFAVLRLEAKVARLSSYLETEETKAPRLFNQGLRIVGLF